MQIEGVRKRERMIPKSGVRDKRVKAVTSQVEGRAGSSSVRVEIGKPRMVSSLHLLAISEHLWNAYGNSTPQCFH